MSVEVTVEEFLDIIATRLDKPNDPFVSFASQENPGELIVDMKDGSWFVVSAVKGG